MENKKISYILNSKTGLCNQLLNIYNGIVLSIDLNRNIIIGNIYCDYIFSNEQTNFNIYFDTDKINEILKSNNVQIIKNNTCDITSSEKILMNLLNFPRNKNLNIYKSNSLEKLEKFYEIMNKNNIPFYISVELLSNDNNNKISNGYMLAKEILKNKETNILYLKNTLYGCNLEEKYISLKNFLHFNDSFVNIINNILREKLFVNYKCVHLRIEDDMINFLNERINDSSFEIISNEIYELYKNNMNAFINSDDKLYVCTDLTNNEYKNNHFYYKLFEKFEIMHISKIISEIEKHFNNIKNQREIRAIVDLFIASNSDFFLGIDVSSFSLFVQKINKNSQIIKFKNNRNRLTKFFI